jgi:hypothetical protein
VFIHSGLADSLTNGMADAFLDFWGLGICVSCHSESVLDDLRHENHWFSGHNRETTRPQVRIVCLQYATREDIPAPLRNAAMQSDQRLWVDPQACCLVLLAPRQGTSEALRSLVLRLVVLHYSRRGFGFYHGSVAERDGNAVAFVGNKGSGKTSFLLSLVYGYGYRFVSDDLMMIGAEDGHPIVHGLQTSINLDKAEASPEEFCESARGRLLGADRWLLASREKRRHEVPPDLCCRAAVLQHVVLPTIHPLCVLPRTMPIPSDTLGQAAEARRYRPPTIAGLALPDVGMRCREAVEETVRNCAGILFLGGLDLCANVEMISTALRMDPVAGQKPAEQPR